MTAENSNNPTPSPAGAVARAANQREDDAIYQKDQLVARVTDIEINPDAKEVQFGEASNSDLLVLADECEFRRFRIMVRKIAYATKAEGGSLHKGRILRGVKAEILGYREQ